MMVVQSGEETDASMQPPGIQENLRETAGTSSTCRALNRATGCAVFPDSFCLLHGSEPGG